MFCGSYRYIINERGELTLPIRFRNRRKKIVVGVWPEGCLFLFSKKEWKRTMKRSRGWFFLSREEMRIIFSRVINIEIDEKGKIRIPDDLIKQVGLEKEVIIAGCGRYLEIWDKNRWKIECERAAIMMRALYDGEEIAVPLKVSSN